MHCTREGMNVIFYVIKGTSGRVYNCRRYTDCLFLDFSCLSFPAAADLPRIRSVTAYYAVVKLEWLRTNRPNLRSTHKFS